MEATETIPYSPYYRFLPIFTGFYRFFGLSSFFLPSFYPVSLPSVSFTRLVYRVYYTPSMLLFERLHVFFPELVLRRNQTIKEVVLVEASSILPLPRRSESR